MARTVFDVLTKEIDEEISLVADMLVQGGVKDYSEYRELCGVIRGLATAKREIQDLAKHQMEDDEDD